MTVLNKDQLLASFPDNNTGQIVALNSRDFVDSVELKYDNWTVVKPSQPNGNKFPDPVSGEITLPAGSTWVINGMVTISDTLVVEDAVTIIGLGQSFVNDGISLDAASGAIPLFKNANPDESFTVKDITMSTNTLSGGTGRVFEMDTTTVNVFQGCGFIDCELGTWSDPITTLFDSCTFAVILGGLSFTGVCDKATFVGIQTFGFPAGFNANLFDFTSISSGSALSISGCSAVVDSANSMFVVNDDNTFDLMLVNGNIVEESSSGKFVLGVDAMTGINATFSGNTGIKNTIVQGGLVIAGNTVVTPNPGSGLWTPIQGDGTDVLTSNTQRFQRAAPLQLEYIGNDEFDGEVILTLTTRRASGGGNVFYSISLFLNGVIVDESGVEVSQQIDTDASTPQNATVGIPIVLQKNDVILAVVRGDGTNNDSVTQNIQMLVK